MAIDNRPYSGWTIATVESITPTGRIKLSSGDVLNGDLRIRGASKYGPYCAVPVTEEIRTAKCVQDCSSRINAVARHGFKNVSVDQLRRIVAILDEGAAQ